MKEVRHFYCPDLPAPEECVGRVGELPPDEASHALRVLRLKAGDELVLMDGRGTFYAAEVADTQGHRLRYRVSAIQPQQPEWSGRVHLAIAPTKMMERIEWLAEKATEIGIDQLSLLDCRFSERRQVKTDRLERIVVAAVKQSRKAWVPQVSPMQPFRQFIEQHAEGRRYIAHCYEEVERVPLFAELQKDKTGEALVLVGPEGDFSIEEVRMAVDAGYKSVSLGTSRLRTETAGLMAVAMMRLAFTP